MARNRATVDRHASWGVVWMLRHHQDHVDFTRTGRLRHAGITGRDRLRVHHYQIEGTFQFLQHKRERGVVQSPGPCIVRDGQRQQGHAIVQRSDGGLAQRLAATLDLLPVARRVEP